MDRFNRWNLYGKFRTSCSNSPGESHGEGCNFFWESERTVRNRLAVVEAAELAWGPYLAWGGENFLL